MKGLYVESELGQTRKNTVFTCEKQPKNSCQVMLDNCIL